jgi:hypothetical protein
LSITWFANQTPSGQAVSVSSSLSGFQRKRKMMPYAGLVEVRCVQISEERECLLQGAQGLLVGEGVDLLDLRSRDSNLAEERLEDGLQCRLATTKAVSLEVCDVMSLFPQEYLCSRRNAERWCDGDEGIARIGDGFGSGILTGSLSTVAQPGQ